MQPGTIMLDKERHLKMTLLGMKTFKEAAGVSVAEATKLPPD